jgi:recombination protein RecA
MAKKKNDSVVEAATDKESMIKAAEDAIRKKFGSGSALYLSDYKNKPNIVIPTGSIGLDYAIGVGGIPRGSMVEIYGQPSSGKTTLALNIGVHSHTSTDDDVLFINAEHSLDVRLAMKMGLREDRTVIVDMPTAEENLTAAETYIKTGKFSVCIIDSIAALIPQAEFDAEYDDQFMGLHPRLMSRMCRSIKPLCSKTGAALILINQTRDKINSYGGGKETTGGNAIKFYADLRIEVSGGQSTKTHIIDSEGEVIGHKTTVKIVKNKVGRPWKTCELDLIYGSGFDKMSELISLGEDLGFITPSGSWYEYKDTKVQGKDKLKLAISERPDLIEELKKDISTVLKYE